MGRSVGIALERLAGVERDLKGVADAAEDFSFCSRAGVFEFGFLEKVGEVGEFMVAVRAHDTLGADKRSHVSPSSSCQSLVLRHLLVYRLRCL